MGGDKFRDEYSLAFDSTDDHIDCGTRIDLGTANFSIAGWVKQPEATNNFIIGQYESDDERWYVRSDASDKLHFYVLLGGSQLLHVVGASTLPENKWFHFAVTADRSGNVQKLYVNGVLDKTDTDTDNSTDIDIDASIQIGRYNNYYFGGNMSEIVIYDTNLSDSQVRTLYNGREPYNHKEGIATGNLKAWYRMGDGRLDRKITNVVTNEIDTSVGAELVENESFDTTDDWTAQSGWTVSGNGVATVNSATAGTTNLTSTGMSVVVGGTYAAEMYVDSSSGSGIRFDLGGVSSGSYLNTTGFIEAIIVPTDTAGFSITASGSDTTSQISRVSVKKLGDNTGVMQNMTVTDFTGDRP